MDLDATQGQAGEEGVENQQHVHVLAVDDSQTDRKFLERLLTVSSNYHVTCVGSGDEALRYLGLLQDDILGNNIAYSEERWPALSSSSPSSLSLSSTASPCHESHSSNSSNQQKLQVSKVNLIMTDFSMPGMSGYDLLKRIKESASWKDIPVVVMSSENVPSRINMCLEGGAEDFLLKPVKVSDLKKLHSNLVTTKNTVEKYEEEDKITSNKGNSSTVGNKMVVKGVADHQLENDGGGGGSANCCGGTINSSSNNNNNSNNNVNMANKRKATLTASSDRSRPRVVQELPVS